jgi:hypothetical protein
MSRSADVFSFPNGNLVYTKDGTDLIPSAVARKDRLIVDISCQMAVFTPSFPS